MRHMFWLVASVALAACQGSETATTPSEMTGHHSAEASKYKGEGPLPVVELGKVRSATAKYHDIQKALADGYMDIDVVRPNMGRHFMRPDITVGNAEFDLTTPEILVYQEGPNGHLRLVAVEYAIPLNLSANAPPGFTGNADVWFPSDEFGLWLLHAWVWKDNPDGMFNATNPNVP
jgi:hypothetical protein